MQTWGSTRHPRYECSGIQAVFNNFTYNYQIRHTHVAIKGNLLTDIGYQLMPFISASVGVGFNQASNFTNTSRIFEALAANPSFLNNTTTTYTYAIGAGIQRNLTKNWQLGIGYEFSDWGKSQLARAPGQTMNNGLTLQNFYTNGVLFNITYLSSGQTHEK